MSLLPELSTVDSAVKPLKAPLNTARRRVLDVGAGVGRVTADVLLQLFSDVLLLEPVSAFIQEAHDRAIQSVENPQIPEKRRWKGLLDKSRSVTFVQGTLQVFDPSHPLGTQAVSLLDRVGFVPDQGQIADIDSLFDVIWCQWCLGHLNDEDLMKFLKRSREAFRDSQSLIVVKENVCSDAEDGGPCTFFDEEDSSLTR